jgi:hypothetical protein
MSPSAIPAARHAVGSVAAADLRRVAAHVVGLESVAEIQQALVEALDGTVRHTG